MNSSTKTEPDQGHTGVMNNTQAKYISIYAVNTASLGMANIVTLENCNQAAVRGLLAWDITYCRDTVATHLKAAVRLKG